MARQVGPRAVKLIVLTDLLPDRPELIEAMNHSAPVSLVIGIPYSVRPAVHDALAPLYTVVTPTLDVLRHGSAPSELVAPHLSDGCTCIVEIGGYFAPHPEALHTRYGERICGFLEDTENGHRAYERAMPRPYNVLSVARSPLKRAEDALVGPSCVFSVERMMRRQGVLLQGRRALVLGCGKVGRSASAIRAVASNARNKLAVDWLRHFVTLLPERMQYEFVAK